MGDGAGAWQVTIDRHGGSPAGRDRRRARGAGRPARRRGAPARHADRSRRDAVEGDAAGYVVLTQGTRSRRIPYWAHVERPRFATATSDLLHPGVVRGSTRGQPDRVQRYRYPAYTGALGLPRALARRRDALPLPPQPSARSTSA